MKTVKVYRCLKCGEDIYETQGCCVGCGEPERPELLKEVEIADIVHETFGPSKGDVPYPRVSFNRDSGFVEVQMRRGGVVSWLDDKGTHKLLAGLKRVLKFAIVGGGGTP